MLTLIWCPFHPRFTAMARKRRWPFYQKRRWQIIPKYAYTLDQTNSKWTDYAVQSYVGTYHGNELTRNSSGNVWSQSSWLAEPLLTDLGLESGSCVRELIFTLKNISAVVERIVNLPLPPSPHQFLACKDKAITIA